MISRILLLKFYPLLPAAKMVIVASYVTEGSCEGDLWVREQLFLYLYISFGGGGGGYLDLC